jgi:hypothetical protein
VVIFLVVIERSFSVLELLCVCFIKLTLLFLPFRHEWELGWVIRAFEQLLSAAATSNRKYWIPSDLQSQAGKYYSGRLINLPRHRWIGNIFAMENLYCLHVFHSKGCTVHLKAYPIQHTGKQSSNIIFHHPLNCLS